MQTAHHNEFSAVSVETSKAAETYGALGVVWKRRERSGFQSKKMSLQHKNQILKTQDERRSSGIS